MRILGSVYPPVDPRLAPKVPRCWALIPDSTLCPLFLHEVPVGRCGSLPSHTCGKLPPGSSKASLFPKALAC